MIDFEDVCEDCLADDGLCAHRYWRTKPAPWPSNRTAEKKRRTLHVWAQSREDLPEWFREQMIMIYRTVDV